MPFIGQIRVGSKNQWSRSPEALWGVGASDGPLTTEKYREMRCTEYADVCHYEGRRAAAMRPLAELLLTLVYNSHDNPYALNKFRIIMLTSFDEYLGAICLYQPVNRISSQAGDTVQYMQQCSYSASVRQDVN